MPIRLLDFVQSPQLDEIALRYRRFADFCRSAKNATVFRYEDVIFTWRTLVAGLIEKLDLQIPSESAFAIADSSQLLGNAPTVSATIRQDSVSVPTLTSSGFNLC
jgi:hypothetical protein